MVLKIRSIIVKNFEIGRIVHDYQLKGESKKTKTFTTTKIFVELFEPAI